MSDRQLTPFDYKPTISGEDIMKAIVELHIEILKLRSDLATTFGDEHDPKRKEMSDRLGAKLQQKLLGEAAARALHEGD